jgi:photosystem II stability/assembly factor-like uncharacterized protein
MNNSPVFRRFAQRISRSARHLLTLCCFFATHSQVARAQQPAPSPHIELLVTGPHVSLRGLSVVSDKVIWVSGSNGTVGRSIDGGSTWSWTTVPGYEKRDFRDIEAFDEKTAIIMAIAEPAQLLKTADGGQTWRMVYQNEYPGMFLDAMDFANADAGIVVGDPIHGHFFEAQTFDGGSTWHDIPLRQLPAADSGEGCFASSGTNIRFAAPASHGSSDLTEASCFVSGGPRSRLFINNNSIDLPLLQGTTSTGANSVAVKNAGKPLGKLHLIVVGGDFAKDTVTEKNCFLTNDGGQTWIRPTTPPHGYRSCVEYIDSHSVLACGTSGVDLSTDDGMNWQLLTTTGFHACRKAKKGHAVFLAGSGGRVARLIL